jgi:hypothetical protein
VILCPLRLVFAAIRWIRETRDMLEVRVTPQELVDDEFAAWAWSDAT